MFANENALVERLVQRLNKPNSPWGALRLAREFDYLRGRTDVIAVTDDRQVVAFEAKLTRWRDALHQAFRNRCFAHCSFVVLPKGTAIRAAKFEAEFRRRDVGLCYVENDDVVVMWHSEPSEPLQPWLSEQAIFTASGAGNGVQS
jgi:hypothetical protein